MKTLSKVLVLGTLMSAPALANNCIPANEYVPFTGVAAKANKDGDPSGPPMGSYMRISPDGKYVIRSLSGDHLTRVTVMELRDKEGGGGKEAIAYKTDFALEAFPVQGTWRFVNDTNGDHYLLRDVLQKQTDAKKQFKGGMTGFYATAAELPGGTDSSRKIRSLAWPDPEKGQASLKNMEVEFKKNADGSYSKVSESSRNYMCDNLKDSDGNAFTLPMISQDGKEFAAQPLFAKDKEKNSGIRIYEFGENLKDCKLVESTGFSASKLIFGFARDGKKAPVTYLGASSAGGPQGVHLYDRELKRSFFIGDKSGALVAVDSFPGMTKDGRVIYGAKWNECRAAKTGSGAQKCELKTGFVISDPNQSEDMKNYRKENPSAAIHIKECITKAEVKKVEDDQRLLYGLGSATGSATNSVR
ncbi:MAG: hypothetical protein HUU57_15950 [Bdellovibrio sp.]|nr:hypothetical protein [Bdellovibrio sp.]